MVESGAAQSSVLFMLIDISLVRHRRCHGQKKKNLPSGAAFWAAQTGNLDALKRLVDAGASLKVIARWMQRILPALRPLGIWTKVANGAEVGLGFGGWHRGRAGNAVEHVGVTGIAGEVAGLSGVEIPRAGSGT